MIEFTGTQGEWTNNHEGKCVYAVWVGDIFRGIRICDVEANRDAKANAALIAKSPAMFNFIKKCVEEGRFKTSETEIEAYKLLKSAMPE